MQKPNITPGRNIALKIPPHEYDQTVSFYRDVLQLRRLESHSESLGFDFDGKDLWLDKVATLSQAEIWLEIRSDNLEAASDYFKAEGVVRCDEVEELPENFEGFWITNPAGLIHLVSKQEL
ncbi:MAG: VOC family protein [Opitutaceae bacterium]